MIRSCNIIAFLGRTRDGNFSMKSTEFFLKIEFSSVIRLLCMVTSGKPRATPNSDERTGLGKEQVKFSNASIQAKKHVTTELLWENKRK